MKRILALLAAIVAYGYATVATAQITFNVVVSGAPQWPDANYAGVGVAPDNGTIWNVLDVGYGTTVPIITNNISDSLGVVFSGVSVTFSNHTAGGPQYTWNDTTGGAPPNPVDLMRTYTFFATYDVYVTGLAPGNYDIWYFGHGDQPNQQGTITVDTANGGGTFKTANSALGRDLISGGLGVAYTNLNGLVVGKNGVFHFQADYLNGFQLRPSQSEGPSFLVTGGSDCSAITVGLSGSVTTNTYMLYRNGAYVGPTVPGTGSAVTFGVQSASGIYTVLATNAAASASGLMYGTASIYTPGISIGTQPGSVSVVTNLPALISIQATGDTLSYQWYKNGVALTNGGDISGVTTTNLTISPAQAVDQAGYTVVIQNPCGEVVTSSPPAILSLVPPRSLIWAGGNPGSDWNYTDLNFLLSGSPATFQAGDDVTFNNSSASTSVTMDNSLTPTLITVSGTASYNFGGPGKITGVSQLVDSSSGTLTIANDNDYSGGTSVGSGAILQLGNGTSSHGSVDGIVDIAASGALNYLFSQGSAGTVTINNGFSGSGTISCQDVNGAIIASDPFAASPNYNGVINVVGITSLHASFGNHGYPLGNGSTVNVPSGGQVWFDPAGGGFSSVYTNTLNVQGTGWLGESGGNGPFTGAIRLWSCTLAGPINLLDDTRIGGTISGGTITGKITGGSHQLEVYGVGYGIGNSSEFILSLGNPANSWGTTLITSGALRPLVPGAISPNTVTIDVLGELDTYGNAIAVNSLSDGPNGNGAVYNMSTSAAGTLLIGGDNSTSSFDGTFGDGSTQPLNLTKVGTGTLTLTAVNTNTGTVTVNAGTLAVTGLGSFAKAAVIAPATGASYDVTGAGGTLALSVNQRLEGNGTVTGALTAPAGSIVNPGLPMGTLKVSGSATVNGTYLPNLNRTNASKASAFTASGGVTFSGATLSVTNVGPKLQVNDVFQLFPSGTSGFTTYALPTNDPANNATYTWNNTVSTDGKITVASVGYIVNPSPTNITTSATSTNITLSWPADHTGWYLQSQTNSPGNGLSTNWVTVPSSAATNQITIPIGSTNGSVFFRMVYTNTP